jgi:hypothetical protein
MESTFQSQSMRMFMMITVSFPWDLATFSLKGYFTSYQGMFRDPGVLSS